MNNKAYNKCIIKHKGAHLNMENIDCRTCQHSRDGTNMSAERYNSFEPDSGYCPGCEMVRALRQSEDSNS